MGHPFCADYLHNFEYLIILWRVQPRSVCSIFLNNILIMDIYIYILSRWSLKETSKAASGTTRECVIEELQTRYVQAKKSFFHSRKIQLVRCKKYNQLKKIYTAKKVCVIKDLKHVIHVCVQSNNISCICHPQPDAAPCHGWRTVSFYNTLRLTYMETAQRARVGFHIR